MEFNSTNDFFNLKNIEYKRVSTVSQSTKEFLQFGRANSNKKNSKNMNERKPSPTIVPIRKNTLINKIKPYTTAIGNRPKPKYNPAKNRCFKQSFYLNKKKNVHDIQDCLQSELNGYYSSPVYHTFLHPESFSNPNYGGSINYTVHKLQY